ncbi:hypothetical protein [Nocardioides alcanivorans]|uniref:hypothetical protein n=1 Tax=Nocardioides alcanivorans TaxID=2897352 RepID=UPI001F375BB1|nr:hypothetical protein [Nocardioides alcanivorans]
MAYEHVSTLAHDGNLRERLVAAAALEGITQPEAWVDDRRWEFAAQPGWADAYASAIASHIDMPGLRANVISDAQILSAVQALNT